MFFFQNENDRYVGLLATSENDRLYKIPIIGKPKIAETKADIGTVSKGSLENYLGEEINGETKELWRKRMGHVSQKEVENMISRNYYGMNAADEPNNLDCRTCIYSKQTEGSSSGELIPSADEMTLHLDICGPYGMFTY